MLILNALIFGIKCTLIRKIKKRKTMKTIKIGDYVKFISPEMSLNLGTMKVEHIDYIRKKCISYCKGGYWLSFYKKFYEIDPNLIVRYEIALDWLETDDSIEGNPIDVNYTFGQSVHIPGGELIKTFLERVYRNNMLFYNNFPES